MPMRWAGVTAEQRTQNADSVGRARCPGRRGPVARACALAIVASVVMATVRTPLGEGSAGAWSDGEVWQGTGQSTLKRPRQQRPTTNLRVDSSAEVVYAERGPAWEERSCLATGLTETPARPASDPAPSAIFAVRGALLLALLWMGILGGGQLGPLKPTRLALRATTPGTTAEGGGASQRAGNSAAVLLAALLFLVAHPTAAVAEGRIVWAFVTDGHPLRWPILVNAVAHAERALAQRADDVIWVVCADERSLRACVRLAAGKPVVLCRDSSDFVPIDAGAVAEDERTWGGEKWTTIVNHIKPAVFGGLIGELVGTSPPPPNATRLCVLDSDLVIRSDPAPLVVKWPIVISTESLGINSGFVCVDIGSKPAVAAFQKYSDTCARSNYTVWEQVVMSSALAGLPPDVLRTVFWADGFDHFCRNPPQDSRPRPNEQGYDVAGSRIVIHAACLFGSVGKQKGLKDVGAWDEDAVSKFPLLARRRR